MKYLLIAVAMLSVNTANSAELDTEKFCQGAVEYAGKYMEEQRAHELHLARMKILNSKQVSDREKLISIMIFEALQSMSYQWQEGWGDAEFQEVLRGAYQHCQQIHGSQAEGTGDIY